jgi:hypothetical protein
MLDYINLVNPLDGVRLFTKSSIVFLMPAFLCGDPIVARIVLTHDLAPYNVD